MRFNPNTIVIITVPTTVFVYDEVWLHELVPQHACVGNISLNLSLDESSLSETISNNSNTCSDTVIPQHVVEDKPHAPTTCHQQPQVSNNVTEPSTNKHSESTTTSKYKFNKNSKYNPFMNLSGKERWAQLCTALSKRQRGRAKKTFQIQFTEHIFSRIFNGKVINHQDYKVKNRLIPIVGGRKKYNCQE